MRVHPGNAVLEEFRAKLLVPLGGRLNQHWLVEAGGEQRVLRRWSQPGDEIAYEIRLVTELAARGWPVAPVVEGPIALDGSVWSVAPVLVGEPRADKNTLAEQRARGQLLATFHEALAQLDGFGQRGTWRRCEAILSDPNLERILSEHEQQRPEDVHILRWHLYRARQRSAGLTLHDRPGMIIHGDFTSWNLHFIDGHLSGILDFELSHWDHRVAEFALAWRGRYDEVIYGYADVSPLEAEEWEMLTPVWWAWLIEGACRDMVAGIQDDGWTIKQLLRRSPVMGPDALAVP